MTAPTLHDEIAALRSLIEETEVTAAAFRKWVMRGDNFDCLRSTLARLEAMQWRPIETAPTNATVIAYGAAGIRFMRKDRNGQWRNMMHLPRNPPTHWMPLPSPPEPQEGEQ